MKKFIVSIKEIDTETGEEREIVKDQAREMERLTVVGDIDGNRGVTLLVHDNPVTLASRIASDNNLMLAAELALTMKKHISNENSLETALLSSIIGGLDINGGAQ